jgi:UTP--glucose-1-phosphate uridylyltransferase
MRNRKPVRKAVLPVAGLGTRMLPATKAVPKEMLPLLGKPMIQYAVEECRASGIEEVIIVTGPGKSPIEAHFAPDPALEALLDQRGRHEAAEEVRRLSRITRIGFVCQQEPLGLGHAVLCAKSLVGREPFAVLLPDVFLLGPRPATAQLIEARTESGESVVAVESVQPDRISHCGIVGVGQDSARGRLLRVQGVVEKPVPSEAPSNLAIMGRYVLNPEIFDCLERTTPGAGNEIQLTDALAILARDQDLRAFLCEGKAFDAGDRYGFFQLSVELALRDPELGAWLRSRFGLSPHEPRIHSS